MKGSLDLFVFVWLVGQMIISSTKLETGGGLLRVGVSGLMVYGSHHWSHY